MEKTYAKKSLGQHFLRSRQVLERIVSAAEVTIGDTVLEIGPGEGVLTRELLAAGAHVVAVEKDERLAKVLLKTFADAIHTKKFILHTGDILLFDIKKVLGAERRYKLVANIPYYITGAILKKFLEEGPPPETLALLIQKEVAERVVARNKKPFNSAHGKESILSISVKIFGAPRIAFNVSRAQFSPPPNVDSALLLVEHIKNPFRAREDARAFFKTVRAGFAQKRKLLSKNLGVLPEVLTHCGVKEKARAEELSVTEWLCVSQQLKN